MGSPGLSSLTRRRLTRRRRSVLVVALVVLLGALGTGLSSFALHESARNWSERTFANKQDVIAKVVLIELVQYGVALTDLSSSLGAQPELTADTFAAITAPINGDRLPGAVEVSYVVPATTGTVADVRAVWQARGGTSVATDLVGGLDGGEDELYLPVLGRPLDGASGSVGGRTQEPEVVDALRRARTDGGVTTSSTFLHAGDTDRSFIMATTVFATAPKSEAGQFRGWVTMTFRGRDFLGPPVGLIGGDQVSVDFADITDGTPVTITSWRPDAAINTELPARTTELPYPPGQWLLVVRPTVRLIPPAQAWLPTGAAAIGSLITVLLAALTGAVVTSRDRALRRVDAATADLRHDIERRETVEQQLRRREEELVGFAGIIAHDLRNPLANVIGFTELITVIDEGDLTEKQRNYLTRVRGSAALMQHLIDDLLRYATADDATLRITDVPLDELVDSILEERLAQVSGKPPVINRSALPTVLGDPTLIRQLLDNLIGNAIKYTPVGRPADITISATAPTPETCRIDIADHGIGIPEAQRAEVFNAFTRASGSERYPGTGLGLAIVQRIVERHNGTVGVDPNPGGGSRFWFTLPTP